MKFGKLLLTATAAGLFTLTGALADWDHNRDRDRDGRPDHSMSERHDRDGYRDGDRGRDGRHDDFRGGDDWRGRQAWHWRDDRGWHGDHDRYWRRDFRGGYITDREIYFRSLRAHGYHRWDGAPYWYQGRYVVRSYDRFNRPAFIELNPYTGGFIGVIRF